MTLNNSDRGYLAVELCDRVFGACVCKTGSGQPNHLHPGCTVAGWMADVIITSLPRNETHVLELVAAGKKPSTEGKQ